MNLRAIGVGLAAAVGLAAGIGGGGDRFREKLGKDEQVGQALERLTFGAQPGDRERVEKMGLKKWIEWQLHPEKMDANPELAEKLAGLAALGKSPEMMMAAYPPPFLVKQYAEGKREMPREAEARAAITAAVEQLRSGGERPKANLAAMTPEQRHAYWAKYAPPQAVVYDLWEAKLYRAIYGDDQLAEVLDDFWFNHFNVFLDKAVDRYWIWQYENEAIRPNVLGRFRDLLEATAKSPAMLVYLDNWQSEGVYSRRAERERLGGKKAGGLNENYARELMELHTLGVNGGYTQKDVTEVARCFTGWTVRAPRDGGGFFFNPNMHDEGKKVVLGHTIAAGGGIQDGEKVLDILARHPATARHIARELAQRFVADDPPEALVERMAKAFQEKDGDLRAVMKAMLEGPEFWSEGAMGAKVKTPFEMVVSAVRALDADVDDAFVLSNRLAGLGEPLYRKQEPTGYSNAGADWLNSAALVARMNFALALARGGVKGVTVSVKRFGDGEVDVEGMGRALLGREPAAQTRETIAKALAASKAQGEQRVRYAAGLWIGSPEFQRH